MSAEARANGWRSFDGIGQREKGGYLYRCDGMPTQVGCGSEIVVSSRLVRVGKKSTGWLVCYGLGDDDIEDKDVVLTFCPECTAVVEAHSNRSPLTEPGSPQAAKGDPAAPATSAEGGAA